MMMGMMMWIWVYIYLDDNERAWRNGNQNPFYNQWLSLAIAWPLASSSSSWLVKSKPHPWPHKLKTFTAFSTGYLLFSLSLPFARSLAPTSTHFDTCLVSIPEYVSRKWLHSCSVTSRRGTWMRERGVHYTLIRVGNWIPCNWPGESDLRHAARWCWRWTALW